MIGTDSLLTFNKLLFQSLLEWHRRKELDAEERRLAEMKEASIHQAFVWFVAVEGLVLLFSC